MQDGNRGDWLRAVSEGLERLGLRVAACRACAGRALLVIEPGPGAPPLEVILSRDPMGRSFASLPGLEIAYGGAGELDPRARRALAVVVRLLERLASRLPADLDAPFVRAPAGLAPHQELAFAFPFCTAERAAGPDRPEVQEVLVRVTGRCNQACPFCSAPEPGPEPSLATLARLLEAVGTRAPRAVVTLTGGEPTLRDDLPELVELALHGGRDVVVQTNAVRLDSAGAVERFRPSARLRFFVSLHAMDEAGYDECTGTRGMLGRALAGVERLLAAGHGVVLGFVANARTASSLTSWVEAVAARFQAAEGLSIHASILLCPERRPAAAEWLVDYRVLGPALEAAWERAASSGLRADPLLSSTHAAIPPCCLSPAMRARHGAPPTLEPRVVPPREEPRRGWVRPDRCARCRHAGACLGVPEAYAVRFGTGPLVPIDDAGPSPEEGGLEKR
jgi:hypothetical protein